MRFLVFLLAAVPLLLAGCTSVSQMKHPLPKCNGYNKRALNKSMWDWQDKTALIVNNFADDSTNSAGEIFAAVTTPDAPTVSEIKSYGNCE